MDPLKALTQCIHLLGQPHRTPRCSVAMLHPTLQPRGLQLSMVHAVALAYCLRVLEAGRLRSRGGQDWVLLRPLSSRFLSVSSRGLSSLVPVWCLSPSSRGHDRSWSNDPPQWPHFNLITFLKALSPNIVIF